jgi:hypothetical protein
MSAKGLGLAKGLKFGKGDLVADRTQGIFGKEDIYVVCRRETSDT